MLKVRVQHGFMEEKAAAVHALAAFAKHCGKRFLSEYFEGVYNQILWFWDFPHELVRTAVLNCLHEMTMSIIREYPSPKWEQGKINKLHEKIIEWIKEYYPLILQIIRDDEDKSTVACAIDLMSTQLLELGLGALKQFEDLLLAQLTLL